MQFSGCGLTFGLQRAAARACWFVIDRGRCVPGARELASVAAAKEAHESQRAKNGSIQVRDRSTETGRIAWIDAGLLKEAPKGR